MDSVDEDQEEQLAIYESLTLQRLQYDLATFQQEHKKAVETIFDLNKKEYFEEYALYVQNLKRKQSSTGIETPFLQFLHKQYMPSLLALADKSPWIFYVEPTKEELLEKPCRIYYVKRWKYYLLNRVDFCKIYRLRRVCKLWYNIIGKLFWNNQYKIYPLQEFDIQTSKDRNWNTFVRTYKTNGVTFLQDYRKDKNHPLL